MHRRDFIAKLSKGALATGAAAGAIALAGRDKTEDIGAQVKAFAKRMDQMEASHKRVIKALIVVASVSTGFDALSLLKGDLLA